MQSKTMTLSSKLVLHFVRFLSLQLLCISRTRLEMPKVNGYTMNKLLYKDKI